MDLKKIINYITLLFRKKTPILFNSKRPKERNKLILNKIEQTSFIKKRNSFTIRFIDFKKLKIFGNNVFHYYILLFLILIGIILYIILGPVFKIKNIDIIKQDNITNMIIAYKSVENYRGSSIFNVDKNEILKNLSDYQQNIRDIKTNIVLPNTLKINIDSYKGIFNTIVNDKSYIVTENGTLIPAIYSEGLNKLIIENKFDKNVFLDYKQILEPEYIIKINTIINSLQENIISLKIKELKYYVIERELHIETEKNTTIIFDINTDSKEQIQKIAIFNKEYINLDKNPIMYIDLRIKNKVFYCTNENEYQCTQNIKSIYSNE